MARLDFPLVLAASAPLATLLVSHSRHAQTKFNHAQFIAAAASIALLYALHAFIWYKPSKFKLACQNPPLKYIAKHPVEVFASLEIIGKFWQLATILVFLSHEGIHQVMLAATNAPTWCWVLCAAYIVIGQGLNASIYMAIGNDGVYYGFKLGRTVPWCTSFPFNVGLRHPQYVGVVLTLLGLTLPVVNRDTIQNGFVPMMCAWASMYIIMSIMEQIADGNKKRE